MKNRPNILIIYTDQQRYDTIRALGADWMHTPNLDRLCAEGTAYTQATTPSPVCMPARWSLHTGQWPGTHRCYSNHHCGPVPGWSLPGLLREGGYRTGLVGKNHSFLDAGDLDVFDTSPEPGDHPAVAARRAELRKPEYVRLFPKGAPGGLEGDPEIYKTEAAIRFIEESAGRRGVGSGTTKPWFLWLSYLNPHTPYVTPEEFLSLYEGRDIPGPVVEPDGLEAAGKPFRHRFHLQNNDVVMPCDRDTTMQMRRVYYGMISLIDREVGRLLEALDRTGQRENTFIIFTSDHGDYMGDHGLNTKSPALYDCLVRVPFIVSHPGQLAEGRECGDFVSHTDILPAVAAVAGVDVPAGVQGRNFLMATGKNLRPAAFSEYGIPGRPYDEWSVKQAGYDGRRFTNPGNPHLPWEGNPVSLSGRIRMVRTDSWKYVEEPEGTNELYDLDNDPNELENVYGITGTETVLEQMHRLMKNLTTQCQMDARH